MTTHFAAISRLNQAWGKPRGSLATPHWGHIFSQVALVKEELGELTEALTAGDTLNQRKELCDVLVTTYGLAHIAGHDIDLDTRHNLNGQPTLAKAAMAQANNLTRTIDKRWLTQTTARSLQDTYCLMQDSAAARSVNSMSNLNRDLILLCYNLGALLGFDVDADMAVVQASNESKFCRNADDLAATIEYWDRLGIAIAIEGTAPELVIKSISNQSDTNGKVYSAGKVLTPAHYQAPEFAA